MDRYEKLKVSLRYFLIGKGYYRAADALEFAAEFHTGKRRDGVTPEFQHQVEIAHYLRTILPGLMYPEDTLCASILHDTPEDYSVPHDVITERYGPRVGKAVFLLDKNGKTPGTYFGGLAMDPVGSIVKGADRIHNLQSMIGVFSRDKQLRYIKEVEEHFLPMLKKARRAYVKQEPAYENIKHVLKSQLELIQAIHMATPC